MNAPKTFTLYRARRLRCPASLPGEFAGPLKLRDLLARFASRHRCGVPLLFPGVGFKPQRGRNLFRKITFWWVAQELKHLAFRFIDIFVDPLNVYFRMILRQWLCESARQPDKERILMLIVQYFTSIYEQKN